MYPSFEGVQFLRKVGKVQDRKCHSRGATSHFLGDFFLFYHGIFTIRSANCFSGLFDPSLKCLNLLVIELYPGTQQQHTGSESVNTPQIIFLF